ncbi:MAG: hypothetical protein HEQ32_06130 [Vampirovibrio sp.]|jgi:hypothetical protein
MTSVEEQRPHPDLPAAASIHYTMDEFFRLSARCEGQADQVQAVAALFQARLINFRMVKELLQLTAPPTSSAQD